MPAEPARLLAKAPVKGTVCRAVVAAAAIVSALFCLAVGGLLLLNQARFTRIDPLNAPELTELRRRFTEAPQDDALKEAIRREDWRARIRFFAYQQRAGTGAWLLLGGALVLLVCLAVWPLLREDEPDIASLAPEQAEWDRRQAARRGLAAGVLLLLAAAAAAAWMATHEAQESIPTPTSTWTPEP